MIMINDILTLRSGCRLRFICIRASFCSWCILEVSWRICPNIRRPCGCSLDSCALRVGGLAAYSSGGFVEQAVSLHHDILAIFLKLDHLGPWCQTNCSSALARLWKEGLECLYIGQSSAPIIREEWVIWFRGLNWEFVDDEDDDFSRFTNSSHYLFEISCPYLWYSAPSLPVEDVFSRFLAPSSPYSRSWDCLLDVRMLESGLAPTLSSSKLPGPWMWLLLPVTPEAFDCLDWFIL